MKSLSFNYTNGDLVGLRKARSTAPFKTQFYRQISTAISNHDLRTLLAINEDISSLVANSVDHHYHQEIYDLFELSLFLSKHLTRLQTQLVIKFIPLLLITFLKHRKEVIHA